MKEIRFVKIGFSIIALIFHIIAFYQFKKKIVDFDTHFFLQYCLLLSLSFVLSVLLLCIRNNKGILFLLIFHAALFFLIGYPLGPDITIEFTLLTVLILEASVYLKLPHNIIYSFIVICLTAVLQRPALVWYKIQTKPYLIDILAMSLYASVLVVISSMLQYSVNNMIVYINQNRRLNEVIQQLSNANIGFQEYATLVEEQSKISERKRVTRDIHDTIGYTLTNIIMMMEAAMDLSTHSVTDSVKLREIFQRTKEQAQQGLNETRHALQVLRSVQKDELQGLRLLHRLVETFEKAAGISIDCEYGNIPWTFGNTIDPVIYHVVQEGLTNAFRHGQATKISIRFWLDDSQIRIYIRDNGSGSPDLKKGIGFTGMEERLALISGQMSANNVEGGFELTVSIPLASERK